MFSHLCISETKIKRFVLIILIIFCKKQAFSAELLLFVVTPSKNTKFLYILSLSTFRTIYEQSIFALAELLLIQEKKIPDKLETIYKSRKFITFGNCIIHTKQKGICYQKEKNNLH